MFDFKEIKEVLETIFKFYFVFPFIFTVDLIKKDKHTFIFWKNRKYILIKFYGDFKYGFLIGIIQITYLAIPFLILTYWLLKFYKYIEIINILSYIFFCFSVVILIAISNAYIHFKNQKE